MVSIASSEVARCDSSTNCSSPSVDLGESRDWEYERGKQVIMDELFHVADPAISKLVTR
jgi:hypothetical protein